MTMPYGADAHPVTNDARWRHRIAAAVRFRDRIILAALTGAGIVSLIVLADWWFRPEHVAHPVLFVALSMAFWYGMGRILLGWVNYLALDSPAHIPAPSGLRVAIFTTSARGEPLEMVATTLEACARISYPHTTYLLDDTRDRRFVDIALQHGAVPLELLNIPGAKAGKINRALHLCAEEFILVLDPDHVPFPEFFDRVLGHFADPRVGFVQVVQAYYNQNRSFTATGAAEQTYVFYGPGLMGLYGHGASVAIGANCTFRRAALESIDGHGVGLAEDLITAIRLHAAGWRSVYVPEIVSRGLVPEDIGSFYRQQLKWARGVYEVLFSELLPSLTRLTWRQRLSYFAIATYYLCGPTTVVYLLFPYLYLWTGVQPASMRFAEFVRVSAPLGLTGVAIYLFVQRWLCDPPDERGLHWRGLALKLACWPVYLAGTVLAVFRADVPYVPTPKQAVRGRFVRLSWPHLLVLLVFASTLFRVVQQRLLRPEEVYRFSPEAVWGMVAFASIPVLASIGGVYAAWQSRRVVPGAPWDEVDVDRIGGDR
jgi:cellulose synthase (UDP-forming)